MKHRIRHHKQHLVAFSIGLAAALCVALFALLATSPQPPSSEGKKTEQYYWQDTKYKDIRTRVVQDNGAKYTSLIEYPVTASKPVNEFIEKQINTFDSAFRQDIDGIVPVANEKFRQNISYQVVRLHDGFLSIEVMASRDTQGATIDQFSVGWTFDLSTGKVVTLTDLFNHNQDGIARFKIYLTRAIVQQVKGQSGEPNQVQIEAMINEPQFEHFLVADSSTLRFDFPEGVLDDRSVGPVSVSLPLDTLQLFLQTDIARKIVNVMPIDQAPKYRAPKMVKGSSDCSRVKCIALTFDDGPSAYTDGLLDTLKQHQAHATFFLIGKEITAHKATVKRMAEEGHTVANHSWSHKSLPFLSAAAIDAELNQTNAAIKDITGVQPSYMRPPNGAIGPPVYAALKRHNMTAVMWSVDTRDWADRNEDIVYNRVVSSAKPGAIIILHDIHKTSVGAVPRILKTLQKQGYAFVSIEELFGPNALPGGAINRAS